jgi:hypothetical protein
MASQSQARQARLAAALRENLKRRKARTRAVQTAGKAAPNGIKVGPETRPNKDKNET